MSKKYNFIYKKLVDDDNDIIGHIAYSIYKKDKIDYVQSKKKSNEDIKNKDLISFHEFSSSSSSLEAYKMKAEIVMQSFIENTIGEITDEIQEELKENQSEQLREVITPLISGFWKSVWAGLLSAFIFAVLLGAFAFILQFQGSSISINVVPEATEKKSDTIEVNFP